MTPQRLPADAAARTEALRPERSCIVQAPAGSGKTSLLVSRFANLLTGVERPEQILAITFTRKAAAEMRQRVLSLLEDDQDPTAAAIRARDEALGWQLAANPSRLQIQTIDSFAMSLAGRLPLASGFGRRTKPVEDGARLHEAAANKVLDRLFNDDPLGADIARFLAVNDNDAGKARRLLVNMLGRRDQWLDAVRDVLDDRQSVRSQLEQSVQALIQTAIDGIEGAMPAELRRELAWMVDFAARPSDSSARAFWAAAAKLCITDKGKCRKRLTDSDGFPRNTQNEKARALDAIAKVGELELASRLAAMPRLPEPTFTDEQMEDLLAVCTVLVLAVNALSDEIRAQHLTDFTELNLAARRALRSEDCGPTELALALDYRIRHILIDEFQDTSIAQFELLELLVEGWSGATDVSLFAVGDPMQSIYRFRDADVSRFYRAEDEGINGVALDSLRLTANFRSAPELVAWFNTTFAPIMGDQSDPLAGQVPYGRSTAESAAACATKGGEEGGAEVRLFAEQKQEVEAIIAHIKTLAKDDPKASIALLVRSRKHLDEIIEALRRANVAWQAIDIDSLDEAPVVMDLLSLASALANPKDSVAWLSVLRAPWVGLDLPALEEAAALEAFDPDSLDRLAASLGPSNAQRLARLTDALRRWLPQRYERPPRTSLEAIWLDCGAPAAYGGTDAVDQAERLLELVDELGAEGWDAEQLRIRANGLYAANNAPAQLQIMTIHKAKGLEFDHVLLPCLERSNRTEDAPLLRWRPAEKGILMATKDARTAQRDSRDLYAWLAKEENDRDRNELQRLLYVACTRAKRSLLLTATHAKPNPPANSLLALLWPTLDGATTEPAIEAEASPAPEMRKVLHRLPAAFTWHPPQPEPLRLARSEQRPPAAAADLISDRREVILGNLIHDWLRRLGERPLPEDPNAWAAAQRRAWERQLRAAGLADTDLETTLQEAARQLTGVLDDEAGRWLLAPHAGAASEYGVTGMLDGVLTSAFFDRTFETEGVRWIIDYKTGPADDQASVIARHRPQLARYRALAQGLFDAPIKTALYLTAIPQLVRL